MKRLAILIALVMAFGMGGSVFAGERLNNSVSTSLGYGNRIQPGRHWKRWWWQRDRGRHNGWWRGRHRGWDRDDWWDRRDRRRDRWEDRRDRWEDRWDDRRDRDRDRRRRHRDRDRWDDDN